VEKVTFIAAKHASRAYPEQYKKHQKKERELEADQNDARESLRRLATAISKEFGVQTREELFDGQLSSISIHYWAAQKAEKRKR